MRLTHIFLVLALNTFSFVGWAQPVRVFEIMGRSRAIVLDTGMTVGVRFADYSKKKERIKSVYGKITQLTDSTITIKKLFKKEDITVTITAIQKLRKQTVGRYVVMAALPVVLTVVSLTVYPMFPPLIVLSIIPSMALANAVYSKHTVKVPVIGQQ